MAKFKVGDRVRATEDSLGGAYTKGRTYQVRYHSSGDVGTVVDDRGSTTNGWNERFFELVPTGPTRTVTTTRTEIVPGVYGRVAVGNLGCSGKAVPVGIETRFFGPAELTDAIATLTAIRDALVEVA